jgi:hypothetical protein
MSREAGCIRAKKAPGIRRRLLLLWRLSKLLAGQEPNFLQEDPRLIEMRHENRVMERNL